MKKFLYFLISLLNKILYKDNKKICFFSFPDFSDNAKALFEFMIVNNMKEYKYIWLVSDKQNINKELKDYNISIAKKNSLLGVLSYMTSKYVFYTHGLYNGIKISKKQVVINLWHGMPLKNIGLLDEKAKSAPLFSYAIATSEFFRGILSKSFGVPEEKILITGQPRNDKLSSENEDINKLSIDKKKYKKIFIWLPTFRRTEVYETRADGFINDSGLPFISKEELVELNDFLEKNKDLLIIKLHPMSRSNSREFNKFSHIKIFKSNEFINLSCDLYSLLNDIDALITDYSSIYFDFLILNKPIAFAINDYDEYKKSRGYVISDIYKLMPGEIIKDFSGFKKFISETTSGIDKYKSIREEVNAKYINKYNDDESSKRILKYLGLIR